jgi:protein-tyrosine phosphatase
MAEGVVRRTAERAGLSSALEVDSAGTHAYHEGEMPDERARKVAASRGYEISSLRARRVSERDFMRFDHILAMDSQNMSFLRRCCPMEHQSKLGMFLDYADSTAVKDVPDPYYGGVEGFKNVLDLCEKAAQGLVKLIARSLDDKTSDLR